MSVPKLCPSCGVEHIKPGIYCGIPCSHMGQRGRHRSEETKRKISEANKTSPRAIAQRKKLAATPRTREMRQRMSIAALNRRKDPEVRSISATTSSGAIAHREEMARSAEINLKRSNSSRKYWESPDLRSKARDRARAWWANLSSDERKRIIETSRKACQESLAALTSEERRQRAARGLAAIQKWWGSLIEEERRSITAVARSAQATHKTSIESAMERELILLGIPYEPNVFRYGYQIDFLLMGEIDLETDGCYFHSCKEHHPAGLGSQRHDAARDAYLNRRNIRPIRVWEHDVRLNPKTALWDAIDTQSEDVIDGLIPAVRILECL